MEPSEMEEFAKEMREGGEKAETSMTHVSLIISVLAVLVAMVTVLGHREHTEAVLLKSNAVDQWNQYQERKIRIVQESVGSDLLTLQPSTDGAKTQAKIGEYKASIAKWNEEIKADAETARDYDAEVKLSEKKAGRFDLSEALLEIGVVLASITLLTRHQRYVVVGSVLGAAGVVLAASAFLVR